MAIDLQPDRVRVAHVVRNGPARPRVTALRAVERTGSESEDLAHLRKSVGLAISDRIQLRIAAGPVVGSALSAHGSWVSEEVLAVALDVVDGEQDLDGAAGVVHHVEVDGESARVFIDPA